MSASLRDKTRLYLDLIRWSRPAGWLLLLWPTLGALWVAAHGFPGWHLLAVFTLGTILMRSAGCCVNDVADRDFDKHVKRTAQESFDPEAFMLRRSMPWMMSMQAGLMFVAFGKSLYAFEAQMRRMAGLDDNILDGVFRLSKPVTGAYFWCPPMRGGQLDLRRVGCP